MEIPVILRSPKVRPVGFLRNIELADAAGNAIVNARSVERAIVGEVRVKHVAGAPIDGELPRTQLHAGTGRLRALQIHSLRGMLRFRVEAVTARKISSMPDRKSV